MHRAIVVVLLSFVFGACATSNGSSAEAGTDVGSNLNNPVDTEGLRSDCFFVRDANDWEAVNRVNLIVYAPRSRPYLVLIGPPSTRIRNNVPLRFEGNNGRVCGRAGERMIVGRGGSGRTHGVFGVWRLDDESLARILDGGQPDGEPDAADGTPGR